MTKFPTFHQAPTKNQEPTAQQQQFTDVTACTTDDDSRSGN